MESDHILPHSTDDSGLSFSVPAIRLLKFRIYLSLHKYIANRMGENGKVFRSKHMREVHDQSKASVGIVLLEITAFVSLKKS